MTRRVLIHSQSLLGIGHERRTQLIADAFVDAGLDTHLALGGPSALGTACRAATHQLPTLRAADAAFSALVDDQGNPVDDQYRATRRDALATLFNTLKPDALVLELFPFGRRMLRFELLPLLDQAARSNCRVFCSLRDVLVSKAGQKAADKRAWAIEQIKSHFDAVMVHGDPTLIPLNESFAEADQLDGMLQYTGLVAPQWTPSRVEERRGVLVSAGGGAVGEPLLTAAVEAARNRASEIQPWTLVAGPHYPTSKFKALEGRAAQHTRIVRSFTSLVGVMAENAVSISQAGYNTVCDILATQTPAVLVPFETDSETEQLQRASRLEDHAPFAVVRATNLSPESLGSAIESVINKQAWPQFDLSGATTSARCVHGALVR